MSFIWSDHLNKLSVRSHIWLKFRFLNLYRAIWTNLTLLKKGGKMSCINQNFMIINIFFIRSFFVPWGLVLYYLVFIFSDKWRIITLNRVLTHERVRLSKWKRAVQTFSYFFGACCLSMKNKSIELFFILCHLLFLIASFILFHE